MTYSKKKRKKALFHDFFMCRRIVRCSTIKVAFVWSEPSGSARPQMVYALLREQSWYYRLISSISSGWLLMPPPIVLLKAGKDWRLKIRAISLAISLKQGSPAPHLVSRPGALNNYHLPLGSKMWLNSQPLTAEPVFPKVEIPCKKSPRWKRRFLVFFLLINGRMYSCPVAILSIDHR